MKAKQGQGLPGHAARSAGSIRQTCTLPHGLVKSHPSWALQKTDIKHKGLERQHSGYTKGLPCLRHQVQSPAPPKARTKQCSQYKNDIYIQQSPEMSSQNLCGSWGESMWLCEEFSTLSLWGPRPNSHTTVGQSRVVLWGEATSGGSAAHTCHF